MADESLGDRTEAPTPRRLEEARERGQVPRSADLTAALVMFAAIGALYLAGGQVGQTLLVALREMLQLGAVQPLTIVSVTTEFLAAVKVFTTAVGPICGALIVAAVAANLVQGGPIFSAYPLQPSFEKLDPIKGFERIFARRALVRFAANLAKLGAIAWISYSAITADFPRVIGLAGASPEQMVPAGAEVILGLGLKLSAIFIVLAIFDYMYQRWQFQQDLRMTKQELREEMKRMEGDPLIREQRRHIQRQLAMQRMAAEVPKAHAVITNPTHFAIAIRYDQDSMAAPKVVAKGQDHMARRIRELAMEHGVPIVEKPALARALYRAVQVGQEIPVEFYRAVAEVLAFVYRLPNRRFSPTAA